MGSIEQLPSSEAQRLAALHRYDILDTAPETTFDRITAMAARLFQVPIAVISLVDESRIWFKSHHGLNVKQISRDPGLCASAILQEEPWVLTDASTDPRSKDNALVTGDFGLRFYVGVPLRTKDGFNLGMLCVLDSTPHEVTAAQIADLKDLAAIVMDQMELRLSTQRALAGARRLAGERETAFELAGWLVRESDDRVQSSLELVTGLLRHQSQTIEAAQGAAQLTITANRVAVINLAHQHISAAAGADVSDAGAYLGQLCNELRDALWKDGVKELSLDSLELKVPHRQLIAIGLIVNELVANAVVQGASRIHITLASRSDGYALSVTDDGPGLPEGFDPTAGDGLGMKIVLAQAQHLRGRLMTGPADGEQGAKVTVVFAAPAI
jgi:two-component sensor histidine kinase